MERERRQRIRYLRTRDGVQLAWAEAGTGPLLIKAANWLTHLEYEWESPVWRHWLHFFTDHFRYIRYDERGCGMSGWNQSPLTLDTWAADLASVVDALAPTEPFPLLGISQGAAVCIRYAVEHPERVSRLVLYGGYPQGWARRDASAEGAREYRAMVDLVRAGWGRENPAFRQIFTSRFIPEGTDQQIAWFNELCRKTAEPETAATLLSARAEMDVLDCLERVQAPTLVLHASRDDVVPLSQGRLLASGIPEAQFVELDSRNHILLAHEPAWERFQRAVLDFMGLDGPAAGEDPAFAELSPREREVLALIAEGLANADIAERLAISEKTVRNHLSNVFDKLGVWTRAQAIVFARDRGFTGAARS